MPLYRIDYIRTKISNEESPVIKNPTDACAYALDKCLDKRQGWREQVWAIYVDKKGRVQGQLLISTGTNNRCLIDTRLTLKGALDTMTSQIILVHNHPTGDCRPSVEDIKQTNELRKACSALSIQLYDHIVVGEKEFFSFSEEISMKIPAKCSSTIRHTKTCTVS